MECILVLVTSHFRYLASAPKVYWQAGAEAPAPRAGAEPFSSPLSQSLSLSHSLTLSLITRSAVPGGAGRRAGGGGAAHGAAVPRRGAAGAGQREMPERREREREGGRIETGHAWHPSRGHAACIMSCREAALHHTTSPLACSSSAPPPGSSALFSVSASITW
jgi:hypothetical protein